MKLFDLSAAAFCWQIHESLASRAGDQVHAADLRGNR